MTTRTRRKPRPAGAARRRRKPLLVERYSDKRVAEFLLSNAVDAADYARAVALVRKMGLDPARIDDDKPIGVE